MATLLKYIHFMCVKFILNRYFLCMLHNYPFKMHQSYCDFKRWSSCPYHKIPRRDSYCSNEPVKCKKQSFVVSRISKLEVRDRYQFGSANEGRCYKKTLYWFQRELMRKQIIYDTYLKLISANTQGIGFYI